MRQPKEGMNRRDFLCRLRDAGLVAVGAVAGLEGLAEGKTREEEKEEKYRDQSKLEKAGIDPRYFVWADKEKKCDDREVREKALVFFANLTVLGDKYPDAKFLVKVVGVASGEGSGNREKTEDNEDYEKNPNLALDRQKQGFEALNENIQANKEARNLDIEVINESRELEGVRGCYYELILQDKENPSVFIVVNPELRGLGDNVKTLNARFGDLENRVGKLENKPDDEGLELGGAVEIDARVGSRGDFIVGMAVCGSLKEAKEGWGVELCGGVDLKDLDKDGGLGYRDDYANLGMDTNWKVLARVVKEYAEQRLNGVGLEFAWSGKWHAGDLDLLEQNFAAGPFVVVELTDGWYMMFKVSGRMEFKSEEKEGVESVEGGVNLGLEF